MLIKQDEKHFQEIKFTEFWNNWINLCKKPIAYDFAQSFLIALIIYSIIALGGHYILGNDALESHDYGIFFGFLTFFVFLYLFGKRNGWLKSLTENLDDEVEL